MIPDRTRTLAAVGAALLVILAIAACAWVMLSFVLGAITALVVVCTGAVVAVAVLFVLCASRDRSWDEDVEPSRRPGGGR